MTHPDNKARGKYEGGFEDLCANCDRPIPFLEPPTVLWGLGWVQMRDGAWWCPVCEQEWQDAPEAVID